MGSHHNTATITPPHPTPTPPDFFSKNPNLSRREALTKLRSFLLTQYPETNPKMVR